MSSTYILNSMVFLMILIACNQAKQEDAPALLPGVFRSMLNLLSRTGRGATKPKID